MSLREIQDLQYYRGKKLTEFAQDANHPATVPTPLSTLRAAASTVPPPVLMPAPPKISLPNLTVADEPLHPKLLKLKAELVSILSIIPEKSMRWGTEFDPPEPESQGTEPQAGKQTGMDTAADEDEDEEVGEAGQAEVKSVAAAAPAEAVESKVQSTPAAAEGAPKTDSSPVAADNVKDSKDGDAAVETDTRRTGHNAEGTIDEDAAVKAERRRIQQARRSVANVRLIRDIRAATTSKELFDIVITIQNAIPLKYLIDFDPSRLPTNPTTLSVTAQRIYSLDRALRYEDWKGIEATIVNCEKPFRPRASTAPRCFNSIICTRYLGHEGRCTFHSDTLCTRIYDLTDLASSLAVTPQKVEAMTPAQLAELANRKRIREEAEAEERHRKVQMQAQAQQNSSMSLSTLNQANGGYYDPDSIEHVVPYVPTAAEITSLIWV
jgi:hypothetical protein